MSVLNDEFKSTITIPFLKKEHAEVVHDAIKVEAEPPNSNCKRILALKENVLTVNIGAPEVRYLKTGISSVFDSVCSAIETIDEFSEN